MTDKIHTDSAVIEFERRYGELMKQAPSLGLNAPMKAELQKRNVYPYLGIVEAPALFGGNQRIESGVKKVSYEKIDSSIFSILAGYKKR